MRIVSNTGGLVRAAEKVRAVGLQCERLLTARRLLGLLIQMVPNASGSLSHLGAKVAVVNRLFGIISGIAIILGSLLEMFFAASLITKVVDYFKLSCPVQVVLDGFSNG